LLNTTKIKAIDAVGRTRSFSKAAELLGISQPAVSQQLRDLEKRYHVKLFLRRGNRIELTPLAEEVLEKSRVVLAYLHDLESSLTSGSETQTSTFTIGLSCHYLVMELIAAFLKKFPEVTVDSHIGDSIDLAQQVLWGQLDVAVITAAEVDHRLQRQLYTRQRIVALVDEHGSFAGRDSLDVDQLKGTPMIARHKSSGTRAVFERKLAREGVERRIALETDSFEAMLDAVVAGIGFGIALENEFRGHEGVRALPIEGEDMVAGQYVVCLPEYRDLKTIRAFFALAAIQGAELQTQPQEIPL